VTISRFQVEFIVKFRVLPNSRNCFYADTNRLKSRNESVNSPSHKHSNSICNLPEYAEHKIFECQKLNNTRSKFKIFKYYKDLNYLLIKRNLLHLKELV